MPAVLKAVEDFFAREPHRGVNPDEVVAVGAAIQAGVLGGEVKDVLLLDVTPLTLGIETLGGVATPLIDRNTTIPTRKSQIFSTASDSQSSVEIHVMQGERPTASDNKTLGRFILDGIPPAPRGVPQIDVTFDIDADGILHVSAKDKATGREQKITITASSGLSKEDIEQMVRDAEIHSAEDQVRKENITLRNDADSTIYAAEKLIREESDKIPADVRSDVESKIADLKAVLESEDVDNLQQITQELQQSLQKVGAAMYEQSEAEAAAPPPGDDEDQTAGGDDEDQTAGGDDEDVVDGDYTEEQ